MTEDEIRRNAFAMPFTSPAYPPGPYKFVNREFMIITLPHRPGEAARRRARAARGDGTAGEV